ncbi:MAG: AAA family ATPase [Parcubacteria group bacterium]
MAIRGNSDPVRAFLALLKDLKLSGPDQWVARCPAHDDNHASLAISRGNDGRVLLNCYAGCSPEKVVRSVGLEMTDLFVDQRQESPEIAWAIRDQDGNTIAVHKRIDKPDGKVIWWERNGVKGLQGLKLADLPLYGMERLKALKDGATVVLCEGEKAADAVRNAALEGIGTACGASATPSASVLAHLVRFKIILWPDNDDVGRKHMQRIAQRLKGATISWISWPDAPDKGDAADTSQEHINELVQSAQEAEPQAKKVQERSPAMTIAEQLVDVLSMGDPIIETDGPTLRADWDPPGIRADVDLIRVESSGDITGLLSIAGFFPGCPEKVLTYTRMNFASSQTRNSQAKFCAKRTRRPDEDTLWSNVFEQLAEAVIKHALKGEDIVVLDFTEGEPPPAEYLLYPILLDDEVTVIFGESGTGKSYLCTMLTYFLTAGECPGFRNLEVRRTIRPLLLDWEAGQMSLKRRWWRLHNGLGLPLISPGYRRCALPLVREASQLRKLIREDGYDFLLVDSLGMAAGGDLMAPQTAIEFTQSLRYLGLPALCVAHPPKNAPENSSIFGSYFFTTAPRSIWTAYSDQEPGQRLTTVGLRNTKSNEGPLEPAMGFRFEFGGDYTKIAPENPDSIMAGESKKPLREQILCRLKQDGPMTYKQLADATGKPESRLHPPMADLKKRGLVYGRGQLGRAITFYLTTADEQRQ